MHNKEHDDTPSDGLMRMVRHRSESIALRDPGSITALEMLPTSPNSCISRNADYQLITRMERTINTLPNFETWFRSSLVLRLPKSVLDNMSCARYYQYSAEAKSVKSERSNCEAHWASNPGSMGYSSKDLESHS